MCCDCVSSSDRSLHIAVARCDVSLRHNLAVTRKPAFFSARAQMERRRRTVSIKSVTLQLMNLCRHGRDD